MVFVPIEPAAKSPKARVVFRVAPLFLRTPEPAALPILTASPAEPCRVMVVVLAVLPTVTPVAVVVPRFKLPVIESNNAEVKLVLAWPVPLILKSAV